MKKKIVRRQIPETSHLDTIHPLLQRVYGVRGIYHLDDLEKGLDHLAPYHLLSNIDKAVDCLIESLQLQHHFMIIGDFDADGATSTAVAVKSLQLMGAKQVFFLVPNRFEYGYGLTPEIVEVAAADNPQVIITVDNGISSVEGVAKAKEKGYKVIITDHHLPPNVLPLADAIINPNLPNDPFPSKNLAGVGVIFYTMMALRAKLRHLNWFQQNNIQEPNMASLLDLVALGTVADVVPLDKNNRILVYNGLSRIQKGKVCPGIAALLAVSGRQLHSISALDLGFAVAPRLNAAGRLVDMRIGIECLLTEQDQQARTFATQLDALNKERQHIEEQMKEQAIHNIEKLTLNHDLPTGLCLFDPSWHQGVVGILASRVKDKLNRPVIAFAKVNENELKGSGRSISGLHLRDVLEKIYVMFPGLIQKFGGHAMAAGLTIAHDQLAQFSEVFNLAVSETLHPEQLEGIVHSDGELLKDEINIETAAMLKQAGPWGQGFPEPIFDGHFKILSHKILKEKHLKFVLSSLTDYFTVDAIAFNLEREKMTLNNNDTLHVAYRLDINEFRGTRQVQLLIEYFDVV